MSTQYHFWSAFKYFGSHLADRFCIPNCSWIINSQLSIDICSCSAFPLAEICLMAEMNVINNFRSSHFWRPSKLCCILGLKIFMLEVGIPLLYKGQVHTCIMELWIPFGIFFCKNRNFMTAQNSTLENSPFMITDIQSMIKNRLKTSIFQIIIYFPSYLHVLIILVVVGSILLMLFLLSGNKIYIFVCDSAATVYKIWWRIAFFNAYRVISLMSILIISLSKHLLTEYSLGRGEITSYKAI